MTSAVRPHEGHPGADREDAGFQRRLGPFDATMLVIGTMIGSGIFVTSQSIANDVGSAGWLLLVWAVAGVMTILGALSYAELAAMMPHAGGQYVFLREAYSPMWGFLYGWTCFLVIQTGSIAAVAVAFAKYLGVLVPELGTDWYLYQVRNVNIELYLPFMSEPFFTMEHFRISSGQLVAVGVIVLLTGLNCRGVQEGKLVQNFFTVAKTLALIGLILIGFFVVSSSAAWLINSADWWGGITDTGQYQKQRQSVSGVFGDAGMLVALMVAGGAMVGALFSMDAWNNVTFTAGETRNPRRNLPLSLAVGTGTVIVLYLLANAAYVASLPVNGDPKLDARVRAGEARVASLRHAGNEEQADAVQKEVDQLLDSATTFERGIKYAKDQRVGTAVVELWSPDWGAWLMAGAIMISTFGCVNGMTLMGARLYCVMARDNLFFRGVGHLNRHSVPAVGLILQGAWSVLLIFSGSYDDLLDFVIFAVLVFYVLTVTGLFVLRRTQPNLQRPVKAFGYPVLPALYVVLCAAIMLDLLVVKPKFTWPGLIIVLTGIPVYFLWRGRKRHEAGP